MYHLYLCVLVHIPGKFHGNDLVEHSSSCLFYRTVDMPLPSVLQVNFTRRFLVYLPLPTPPPAATHSALI